jgi:hypothetical protein
MDTYHPDTLYARYQLCEDSWLFLNAIGDAKKKTLKNNDLKVIIIIFFTFINPLTPNDV